MTILSRFKNLTKVQKSILQLSILPLFLLFLSIELSIFLFKDDFAKKYTCSVLSIKTSETKSKYTIHWEVEIHDDLQNDFVYHNSIIMTFRNLHSAQLFIVEKPQNFMGDCSSFNGVIKWTSNGSRTAFIVGLISLLFGLGLFSTILLCHEWKRNQPQKLHHYSNLNQ